MKQAKIDRQLQNEALGKNVDADFDLLIDQHKKKVSQPLNHVSSSQMNLCVCVRKRPLFDKELTAGEIDCVSASNPKIVVHECKVKVDGITKYVDDQEFKFDNVFSELEGSNDVYEYQIKSLLPNLFKNGVVTCFAYGQTGSGKTFTVNATTQVAVKDLYKLANENRALGVNFYMSFFEIYGGKVMDLLNGKKKLQILEDKYQRIQVQGLEERQARSDSEMLEIINFGHSVRTTHQTVANDTSSRSHAICQINVRDSNNKTLGKFLLVDLAGSERAQDTQSNNRQRRIEGAEINKSLLALKECIRAIDMKSSHVPFRASKLTMVLRDSFLNEGSSKIVMIACVGPGSSSADHTINTLRYAQRLKSNSTTDYNNPSAVGYQQPKPQIQQQQQAPVRQQMENKPPQQKPVQKEEKKRSAWVGVGDALPQKDKKRPESSDEDSTPKEIKQKKKEDWNYLKNTINLNPGEQMIDPQLLTLHEKVDKIVEEEEELRNKHLQYLKEAAQLLTQEGELISNVQGIGSVEYDIDDYVSSMELIIQRNIEIYTDLQRRMLKFKKHLREEEEAHQNVRGTVIF
eukprot:403357422